MAIPKMMGVIMAVVTPSDMSRSVIRAKTLKIGTKLGSIMRSALRRLLK